ncbi:MAG: hypothetical protein IKU27_04000 [Clostridia bacterium]|nr:hypothetical protein [Clostridia bacterium]
MKPLFIPLLFLMAAMLLTLYGCQEQEPIIEPEPEPEPEVDGGVQDDSSYDAPKTIESPMIVAFNCEFSGFPMMNEDSPLANHAYQLEARLPNGAVKGTYAVRTGYDNENLFFSADHSFMRELQQVVDTYDLAQYNGLSRRVSGLPDMYGAYLHIVYASGESIYASDNQDCFLPIAALEDLERLFRRYIHSPRISVEEVIYTEERGNSTLSIRYPEILLDATGEPLLAAAFDRYNTQIRGDQEAALHYTLRYAADHMGANAPSELYSHANICITRQDARVVSFYEELAQEIGILDHLDYRRTFNFDGVTGEPLGYADIFTDPNSLAPLLAEAFAAIEPNLFPIYMMEDTISASVYSEDGLVCFALAQDGVHFFAERNPLGGDVGLLHVTLSYDDHPDLVKAYYR